MSDNGSQTSDKTIFSKPSILRLARKAGIKCVSDECYELISSMIHARIQEIVEDSVLVKNQRGGKVLTQADIQEALLLRGINVPVSDKLPMEKIDVTHN
jgi:histone H3/H4